VRPPWARAAAASSATPVELPTDPETPCSGNCHRRSKPNPSAALLSSALLSPWDIPASAVVQDCAKSVANVAPGFALPFGTLRKFCPPTHLPRLHRLLASTSTPLPRPP